MRIRHFIKRLFALALGLFLLIEGYYIVQVLWYSISPIETSAYIESEKERLGKVQFKPVLLKNISSDMVKATVAAEDVNFMEHFGIEWKATGEAFVNNVIEGERAPGGSTITQQTVKNLFLTTNRCWKILINTPTLSSCTFAGRMGKPINRANIYLQVRMALNSRNPECKQKGLVDGHLKSYYNVE